MVESI